MDTHAPLVSTAATRRTVIAAGAATVVTVAAPDVAEAAVPTRSRFDRLVGETFEATREGRRLRLRLDAVEDASYRPPRLRGARLATWRRESYVLVFSTRATLEQGTWSLRARRSGRFRMFLVPGADRGKRTAVTATFNGWRG
ncbi:hypothetical protein ASC64_11715 [Nocardioides sp. Root122]|uniref:DUF6916 family protein n=1 Tax=Nocardioides TaxID=1839 RepID=UPI000703B194|nr:MULTISPECIES: hypothetical protein [Nocardioides]KQV67860.1 hypothetical protein ASC64_11715 [Nocardioides sp. Root122]MCK9823798.1 hypothetical protein [Nocardioides cavernae]